MASNLIFWFTSTCKFIYYFLHCEVLCASGFLRYFSWQGKTGILSVKTNDPPVWDFFPMLAAFGIRAGIRAGNPFELLKITLKQSRSCTSPTTVFHSFIRSFKRKENGTSTSGRLKEIWHLSWSTFSGDLQWTEPFVIIIRGVSWASIHQLNVTRMNL